MNQINDLLNLAELALASYADLLSGNTNRPENRDPLSDAGLVLVQRDAFAARFPGVVTQYADTLANGGLGTGLNATVFKDAAGNLTLAIRGTDSLGLAGDASDLATDVDIATSGAGYDQIVALVNWWARASAPERQLVNQFRLVEVSNGSIPAGAVVLRPGANPDTSYVLDVALQATATGELAAALAADPDLKVDVTGHSLGGHLALAFSTIFAGQSGPVTVFNAPGFADNTVNQAFFAKLGGTVPAGASITNVIADVLTATLQWFVSVVGACPALPRGAPA